MRQCVLGTALAVLLAAPLSAQLPAIGAPRGVFRLELGTPFANASDQYNDGSLEPWRAAFSSSGIGPSYYPGLSSTQAQVARLSGIGSYQLSIGQATMQAQASTGTLILGATLGITTKLSLFGHVPFVRQQVSVDYRIDSTGANAGFNPADPVFGTSAGADSVGAFLLEYQTALDTLAARIAAGYYDAEPDNLALAQATLASGTAYLAGLDSLYLVTEGATSFVPLAGSAAGLAMADSVAGTQADLTTLGIPNFSQPLPLPTGAITQSGYNNYLTSFGGPIAAQPIDDKSSFLAGDTELGAAYTFIDRWNREGSPGGLRVVATALLRLPTGSQPLPNDFVSLPTGGGQTDIQAAVVADVGGARFGGRFSAMYNDQLSYTSDRRVTLPSQPIPWRNRLASVSTDPGNEFLLSAMPYWQIAPGLAVVGVVRVWSRGEDAVEYASGTSAIPGVSASELAADTQRSATTVGGGLSYAPTPKSGKLGMDAFWLYESVVAASGGVVPKAATMRMGLRWPIRMWGSSGS